MVRMSDIFKQIKQSKKSEDKPVPSPKPVQPVEKKEEVKEPVKEKIVPIEIQKEPKPAEVKISPVVPRDPKVATEEQTFQLYNEVASLVVQLGKFDTEDIDFKSIDIEQLTAQLNKIVKQLVLDNETILALALDPAPQNATIPYIFYHLLNVSIISTIMGIGLGYEHETLIKFSVAAFLCDIAMFGKLKPIQQPKRLSEKELRQIEKLRGEGIKILQEIDQSLPQIEISEFIKVIFLADAYEALVHNRPHRKCYTPFEAMKIILKNKDVYDPRIIKLFLEKVGLYPKGTVIELNTREIAYVVKHNPKHLLAPKILVVYDAEGKKLENTREIDLSQNTTIYITKCLKNQ